MEIVIEFLAHGLDGLDAEPLAGRLKGLPGHFDAHMEVLQVLVALHRVLIDRFDGPAEIVGDAQNLAGEVGHRVFGQVRLFALGPAADVLGLGQRPQQLILQRSDIGEKLLVGRRRIARWRIILPARRLPRPVPPPPAHRPGCRRAVLRRPLPQGPLPRGPPPLPFRFFWSFITVPFPDQPMASPMSLAV